MYVNDLPNHSAFKTVLYADDTYPSLYPSMVLKHKVLYVNCIPFHLTCSPLLFQIAHFPLNIFPPPTAIFIPYF